MLYAASASLAGFPAARFAINLFVVLDGRLFDEIHFRLILAFYLYS